MTTSYTYISRKRSYYYKPLISTEPIIVPAYISTARKIANTIREYSSSSSFWFSEWEDLNLVSRQLISELGEGEVVGKVDWNKFTFQFQGVVYTIERKLSSDLSWKFYKITR